MPQNSSQKIVFFMIILALLAVVGVMRPSIFLLGSTETVTAQQEGGGNGQQTSSVPLLILPTLSANAAGPANSTGAGQAVATGSATNSDTSQPQVGSSVYLAADLQTGKTYVALNAEERWPMASISKLMTAAVVTDVLNPDDHITITNSMVSVDPTQQILHVGDTYTVSDLLRVMLLPSNNVAAEAFAEFYGRANFLSAMNAKAKAWGMTNTYYDDPSGLSAANESTATDLLTLAQHMYGQYPQILAITRTPQVTVANLTTNQPVVIKSINEFAGQADFIGGKTGYTDQADGNLLSIFSYDGRPLFIVVLGINDGVRFDATQKLYTWVKANVTP
jgi:D-alanyl-D-alanine endopeptidase (penicillin-binding protein 7)